jgi:hypothetical protein
MERDRQSENKVAEHLKIPYGSRTLAAKFYPTNLGLDQEWA